MSEPKRIRDFEDHPVLRAAFEAGAMDRAPDGAEARMLAALGLATVAKVATAASAGVKVSVAATAAKTTKLALFAGTTKWVVTTAVVATVTTGGAIAYHAVERSVPPVASEAWTARAPVSNAPSEVSNTPPPRVAPSVIAVAPDPAPSASTRVVRTIRAPSSAVEVIPSALPSAATGTASTLSDELAMLAGANAAVRRRDADAASRALDSYEARFPHGSLASEAESLRIETVALRDPARGRALAAAFLERNPTSPVAPRMRKLAEAQ